jgi:helicase
MVKIAELTSNPTINLALDTIKMEKQALVFVSTKRSAERTALDIAKKVEISSNKELVNLTEKVLSVLAKPTKQCKQLAECVKKGISFHHAGLHTKQKELVEDSFRSGLIKVIACTPTLAAGLDLPAFRTILRDLKRYGHRGYDYIPVLEYLQMAGRAGRPKYDKFGESICIAASESDKEKIHERYIMGEPEEIYSKLAVEPVLRTYLVSLISSSIVNDKKSILKFFSKTFWAHQFKDMDKLEDIIVRMLGLLEEWEFIKTNDNDFISASEINDGKIEVTKLGKRVAELYIDPLTAHFIIECMKKATGKLCKDFSFIQMISHTLEMRPLLKVKVKEFEEIQENLVEYESVILEDEPSLYDTEYDEYMNSMKTAFFFMDWVNEKDEEYLLEKYNVRPGELNVKLNIADWLLYCAEEMCRILQFQHILKDISKIRFRVKYGVKEELITLLKLKNVGRMRARKLYHNKIKTIADVKKADINQLVQLLGKKVSLDIKEQVGQKFDQDNVAEKKEEVKGQSSLSDYC